MSISIFLSYAHEDVQECDKLFDFFSQLRLPVFRDSDGLYGSENWEEEILDKARASTFFVFLASSRSINKPGMLQKELEIARRKLESEDEFRFFTIRIDDSPLKEWMNVWQYERFVDDRLWDKLAHALNNHIEAKSAAIYAAGSGVFVNRNPLRVTYDTDCCNYEYDLPSITIIGQRHLSAEINQLIYGRISELILRMRGWVEADKRGEFSHGSQIVIELIDADVSSDFVSFSFEHFASFDGAAHPQHHFLALNIRRNPWSLAEPCVATQNLETFVSLVATEVSRLQGVWERDALLESLRSFEWSDHTVLTENGVKFLFPDYTIGPYVFGSYIHYTTNSDILECISFED